MPFQHLHDLDEMEAFIKGNHLVFLYISRPGCSVCEGLKPQVLDMLEDYPEIQIGYVDASETEAVAGRFDIFAVPVLLLLVEGKEFIREARIVHLDLLHEKIAKIYRNAAGTD